MGRRIVIVTWGSIGDLLPYLAIARGLGARGHEVTLGTHRFFEAAVEGSGVRFAPVGPHTDPADETILRRSMEPRTGTRFVVRDLLGASLRETYQEARQAIRGADLLLTHPFAFAAHAAARVTAIPWISTVLSPYSLMSARDPPVLPHWPELAELRPLGRWVNRAALAAAQWSTRSWTAPLRALHRELGLPAPWNLLDRGHLAPSVLALFSPRFAAPQDDWPAGTRATGFPFADPPERQLAALTRRWQRFLDDGPPPIVFTLGTAAVWSAGRFYLEAVAAAQRLGRRAILLIGRNPQNAPPPPLPREILVLPQAPHAQLFPRASAIVHQGGIGTTGQALRAGRPMLVVPYSHDQLDHAARLQRHGVARALPSGGFDARAAAIHLDRLLSDERYARAAAALAAPIAAEDGVAEACARIEQRLGADPPN